MGTYDNIERTTVKGKVVYKRPKHYFKLSDVDRIITKINNDLTTGNARILANAIKIRSIFKVSQSLYAMVDDLFDKPLSMSDNNYYRVKDIWRRNTDELIGMISTWVALKSGIPQLGIVLDVVGRWINRGMEYVFTGHTDY